MQRLVDALQLSPGEVDTVGSCIRAILDGPFINDWEFGSVMGVERIEARSVAQRWPDVPMSEENFYLLNASLNNLSGYPHGRDDLVLQMTGIARSAIGPLLDRIRQRVVEARLDATWERPLTDRSGEVER